MLQATTAIVTIRVFTPVNCLRIKEGKREQVGTRSTLSFQRCKRRQWRESLRGMYLAQSQVGIYYTAENKGNVGREGNDNGQENRKKAMNA